MHWAEQFPYIALTSRLLYYIYTGGIRIHAYLSVYTFFFSFHICSIYNYTFTRAWLTRVFDGIRRNKIVYCLIRVILNSAHLHTIADETRFCFLAQSHVYKRKQFWDLVFNNKRLGSRIVSWLSWFKGY